MALGGGLEAGSVFARLGASFDDDGFNRWERRLHEARADARQGADAVLSADDSDFRTAIRRFKHEMGEARNERASAKIGATYDRRPFDAMHHDSERVRTSSGAAAAAVAGVGSAHQGAAEKTEKHRRSLSMLAGPAGFAAAGAAAYGVVRGVVAVNDAFLESQRVGRQTQQVIKTTGGAANVTAKQVGDLATAISKKTGVDDEAIQSGANLLLTFTNVRNEVGKGNDIFNRATQTVTDMSAALGQDTKSSAIQLGKALNDPIKGVTALQRVGVSFTQSQKDQIKGLVEHGRTLDAQKIILRELNKEFGGTAAATATNAGRLKTSIGNVAESIGGALNPMIEKGSGFLVKLIDGFNKGSGAGGRMRKVFGDVVGAVRDVVRWFSNAGRAVVEYVRTNEDVQRIIGQVRRTVGTLITFLRGAFADAKRIFRDVLPDLQSIGSGVIKVMRIVEDVIQPVMRAVLPGLGKAFEGVLEVVRNVVRVIAGIFKGDFRQVWDGLKGIVGGALKAVLGIIKGAGGGIKAGFGAIWDGVKGTFEGAAAGIIRTAVGFINGIIGIINKLPFVSIGKVSTPGWVQARDVVGPGATQRPQTYARGGIFEATGGIINAPGAIFGEEAPEHPEVVIPSNPAYRGRAIALWEDTARMLGIPGFSVGGAFGAVGHVLTAPLRTEAKIVGKVASTAADLIGGLPHNPFTPPFAQVGSYVLDKAKDFIRDKAKSIVGAGGGGGEVSSTGLVGQVVRALAWARSHGWRGSVTSGFRSVAEQQALWDNRASNPYPVAPPGSSSHGRGQAVDVSDVAGFARAMAVAPKGARLYSRVPSDPVHFSVTGFATGGARGKKKHAPKPILSNADNRGVARSLARGDRGVGKYEVEIRDLERTYQQKDRAFGMTDEVILVEHDDGSVTVDEAALNARVKELDALIRIRKRIAATIERYRAAVVRMIARYQQAVAVLRSALDAAKGDSRAKERAGYRAAIDTYVDRIADLRGVAHDLPFDAEDTRLDLAELRNEKKSVQASQGSAAPTDAGAGDAGGDVAGGGGTDDPDLQAQLDQANARATNLAADLQATKDNLAAFSGPGDIGAGGANAFAAGAAYAPVGAGASAGAPGGGVYGGGSAPYTGGGTHEGPLDPRRFPNRPVVVVQYHGFVPPTGADLKRMGDGVAQALDAQPFRPAKSSTVG